MQKLPEQKPKSSFFQSIRKAWSSGTYRPGYRVVNIEKDKQGDYYAIIQIIGKGATFKMKPEEILANDKTTNQFSPCDIRTLTYLGYLGINAPKYTILAKKLSQDNDNMIFAVKKKGAENIIMKTASEISSDDEILKSLNQKDAHEVGYQVANEQQSAIEKQKKALLK